MSFECTLDRTSQFLAVQKSSFQVGASVSSGQPLFRYEFDRGMTTVPQAHLHVHGHRDSLTYVMMRSGSSPIRRRNRDDRVPLVQDLYFPLGTHRFRPCLEDVLQMLVDEFGVDHQGDSSTRALPEGRRMWHRLQTRAVVRDDVSSAIAALTERGCRVEPPGSGVTARTGDEHWHAAAASLDGAGPGRIRPSWPRVVEGQAPASTSDVACTSLSASSPSGSASASATERRVREPSWALSPAANPSSEERAARQPASAIFRM